MIDYSKLVDFVNEHDITQEEMLLLYGLFLRNEMNDPSLYKKMGEYYRKNKNKIPFNKMVRDLDERGFLEILKENKDGSFDVENLKIDQKFIDLLFIDEDSAWNQFYSVYPREGLSPDGREIFVANMITDQDKEYFKKHILKNCSKQEFEKVILDMESLFDYDHSEKKPKKYARLSIHRFLLNYQEIMKQWREEEDKEYNWNSTRL